MVVQSHLPSLCGDIVEEYEWTFLLVCSRIYTWLQDQCEFGSWIEKKSSITHWLCKVNDRVPQNHEERHSGPMV